MNIPPALIIPLIDPEYLDNIGKFSHGLNTWG
jgi:hypothetical protein